MSRYDNLTTAQKRYIARKSPTRRVYDFMTSAAQQAKPIYAPVIDLLTKTDPGVRSKTYLEQWTPGCPVLALSWIGSQVTSWLCAPQYDANGLNVWSIGVLDANGGGDLIEWPADTDLQVIVDAFVGMHRLMRSMKIEPDADGYYFFPDDFALDHPAKYDDAGPCCFGNAVGPHHDPDCFAR